MGRGSKRGKGRWKVYKNEEIKAPKILVIGNDGKKKGVKPRNVALRMAADAGLDLVQLSYDGKKKMAKAKIVDYGKYMYEKSKAESRKRKKQMHKGEKTIKFGYNIGDHDLKMKLDKAKEFLHDGYNVKLMAVLRGREKAYKNKMRERFKGIEEELEKHGRSQGIQAEGFGFTLKLMATKNGKK